jgi:hypothetical protein
VVTAEHQSPLQCRLSSTTSSTANSPVSPNTACFAAVPPRALHHPPHTHTPTCLPGTRGPVHCILHAHCTCAAAALLSRQLCGTRTRHNRQVWPAQGLLEVSGVCVCTPALPLADLEVSVAGLGVDSGGGISGAGLARWTDKTVGDTRT